MLGWIILKILGLCHPNEVHSGIGRTHSDLLTTMQFKGDMDPNRGGTKDLSKSYSSTGLGRDEEYSKFQQDAIRAEETSKGKELNDSIVEPGGEQYGADLLAERESSNDCHSWCDTDDEDEVTISSVYMGTSPVEESTFFGSNLLEAELEEASDALDKVDSRLQVKLMVGEAVLRGILTALERDSADAVAVKEAELRKVKEQLHEKDSIVKRLINTLERKGDNFEKLVEEGNRKEHQLVMDMLMEREKVLEKVTESEIFVASKEQELLKMAESLMGLVTNLDGESVRVRQLEKQLSVSKESESSRGREMMAIKEKMEQFKSPNNSVVDLVNTEARLKELCLTDSLVEKDKLLSDQLQRINILETSEKKLKEDLQVQSGEVARLVQSGKDTAEVFKALTTDVERLNNRIQELLTEKSTLVDELHSHKTEIEAKETQLEKQEDALQDAKIHIQTVSLSEQHLREETLAMSANLQEYVEATRSLKMKMEDQNWKYEFETGLVMETLKGKMVQLAGEINLLRDALAETPSETITFQSKILQKIHAELISLRSSKFALEDKIGNLDVASKSYEQSIEEKDKMLEDKVQMLRQAESAISHLEEKLNQREPLLQNHKIDVEEIKCHKESMKKQQKALEENAQMLREAEDRIHYLEQEVAVKEGLVQQYRNEVEDGSWRSDFEQKFISTYVENSFQELLKQIVEIQGNLVSISEKLICGQNDLEAAYDELMKSKAEIEGLKSDITASSTFVDQLQTEVKGYVAELAQTRVDLQCARSESEGQKGNLSEEWKEMNCLRKQLDETLLKKREEVVEVLEKLEESEWKSQAHTAIILGLVEGSTQETAQEFAQLREELKLKHQEVLSLHTEIAEQNQKLSSYVSDLSDLKITLLSKDQELLAFRQGTQLTRATQQDACVQEQSIVKGALKEIENLRKLKMTLVARIDEENEIVQQLEEELAEQKWKNQVELDMVSTVFWEERVGIAAMWNTQRAVLLGEEHMHQELGGQKPSAKEEAPNHVSQKVGHGSDQVILESSVVQSQGKVGVRKHEGRDMKGLPPVDCDSVTRLVRQNSELCREKEKLLEQKTDEIYKLKREFYKELEKVKREWKSESELRGFKRESSGLRRDSEAALEGKESIKLAWTEKKLLDDERPDSKVRVVWDNEKSSLLGSIPRKDMHIKERDEQNKDVSTAFSFALEKERNHMAMKASSVENLAALEKERNQLNSIHEEEKEKLIAHYQKVIKEKGAGLNRAINDIKAKNKQIAELEGTASHSKDEIGVLRTEVVTLKKYLESDLAEKMQALVASSQQLENDLAQRMKQYNLRLEGAQGLLKGLPRQFSMHLSGDKHYLQNIHNLQKAETEVDMLGDEVDALMDILEKVYSVLNHYAPITQHYPGLAELVKVVRQEVLQRICESNDG